MFPGCVMQFSGRQVGLEQGRSFSADTAASPSRNWCCALFFAVLHTMASGHSGNLNLNRRVSSYGPIREREKVKNVSLWPLGRLKV